MTLIVKKTTQLIAGMIFMYGIYVIVHGHLTPGGGFAGGVIIAGSFILITLAYGGDFLKLLKEETGTTIVESLATIMVIFDCHFQVSYLEQRSFLTIFFLKEL